LDPTELQPGQRLDRYELLCPLAYGGMAAVWLARFGGHLGFERLVVIKMILPQFSKDPRFQQMFFDETRIASKIVHPNVARILDVGSHEGSYFLVIEWIDGDSLSKILKAAEIRQERIPAGVALRIAADVAAGLHAAHELRDRDGRSLGVVHRDVSPQNILVSNDGVTSLIDFGVAKARDRFAENTRAGQLKGKIRYMAPERACGADIDRRADEWSVGALLYEMFSGGRAPYEADSDVTTLRRLSSGAPLEPLPADTPRVVQRVIDRALAYAPQDRYPDLIDLNHDLEAAMVELGLPTTPATVARYTSELLAERRSARRRAVDKAVRALAVATDDATGAASIENARPPPSPNDRRRYLVAAGAGAALLLAPIVAVTALGAARRHDERTRAQAHEAPPVAEPLPPPTASAAEPAVTASALAPKRGP
jgi:serine/threonine-protein kinase